ncbi:DUF5686 and carboxypeptidase regulatory-like domain-containing protein [Flavihumibacter profundi]|uniref:DUF5686 and carboxypeptidase regulatory-like domain-containing protein n=1 Tax=Flavihumibacter profundi TaxID=2716883 RepID=UPI001CC805D0|nr:DUF5686 and carboxypeptidase regulatory-like domain-containing protein [Flavihumibacter profundi]MBZ5855908.1 DUF5686 and carboxypeptidase regulatory-like domain-containing protein [Flavihumibacter profundi]
MRIVVCFLLLLGFFPAFSGTISGFVKDDAGKPLAYASVYVKNGREGTTTGVNGNFQLNLPNGEYTLIAQYVGYARQEKTITVVAEPQKLDFILTLQQVSLNEVVVRPGGEDPAYEIIRNAIKKRKDHLQELDHFSSEVYTKEQLQLRNFPDKFMGKKVDFEDGDTSKRKILYLSETVAKYSIRPPDKSKLEVLSTRVSGSSNSFGLSLPQIINFYENNIEAGGLNPRGFISPISDNALNFYKYHFEGSFWEDGVEVNRIKVTPKRKFEPVFSGYIMIVENEWRIHSLQLKLLKSSQMQVLDTLTIEQLYAPLTKNAWVIRNQVLYPAIKFFGFDAFGSSVTVYSKFNLDAEFAPKYFNNAVVKYYEGSNRKGAEYWDSVRPLPLQPEEMLDFHRKDSLEQVRKNPRYLDSLDRLRNKVSVTGILFTGESFERQKKRETYSFNPLLQAVSFNTVEGWLLNISGSYSKRIDSTDIRKMLFIRPVMRYGFSSQKFYGKLEGSYSYGKKELSTVSLVGGKYVFQYNNNNPIGTFANTLASLFWEQNYMKLYEAGFIKFSYTKELGNGLNLLSRLQYQDRAPLENSTSQTWRNVKDRTYTPNYPVEIMNAPMEKHQAVILDIGLTWRPGVKYIEFPDRKMNLGSKYPLFSFGFSKGIKDLLGSDIDYLKWEAGIKDDLNFKLGGELQYNISAGGFLQHQTVQVPDYKHFNGNQVALATNYLSSFQALPYYQYSNTESIWFEGHLEHHFNGLLTNKIPGFRSFNWYLVGGANGLWLDGNKHYEELFLGLENIFKIIRADVVWSFDQGHYQGAFFRISARGILSGSGSAE